MLEAIVGVVLAVFLMVASFLLMVVAPMAIALTVMYLIFGSECDCDDLDTDDSEL